MNKANKQSHKESAAKRIARNSVVLSSTRALSMKLLNFFENGKGKFLAASVTKTDRFVRYKVTAPLAKKMGLRKNFSVPFRNTIASFFDKNFIFKKISAFRTAFLNSSLRSVGVFLLSFGIYGLAAFLLKRFVISPLGNANPDELSFSLVAFLAGLLLSAFGDKSIISSLGNSRIVGNLLLNLLGVNSSSFERYSKNTPRKSGVMGFLFGSVLGVLTLFLPPATVFLNFFLIVVAIAILHIPEFGLLLAVSTLSFLPVDILATISIVSIISYLVKYLRLKRNFRCGTADVVVAFLFLAMVFAFSFSGGDISQSEGYILCFTMLYFLAKNLICSKTLVVQTFNALCTGLSLGMALYILGEYAIYIPHNALRDASLFITQSVMSGDMLFMLLSATLPFAFSSFSALSGKRPNTWFVLMSLVSAIVTDSFLGYALILVSFFVFVAFATKSPVGSALAAAIMLPAMLTLISDFTASSAVKAGAFKPIYAGTSENVFSNLFSAFGGICGVFLTVLLLVALLLIMQRAFGSTVLCRSRYSVLVCGTVSASAIMLIVCSLFFNPLADMRVLAAMWFVFGLCGSVYKVFYSSQPTSLEG